MSKNSFQKPISIKQECQEDWDAMTGNEVVRFCSHCAKDVTNISELTRKEAMRLVRRSNGNLCVRFKKDMITQSPVFAPKLHRISRTSRIAAGVFGASIVFSSVALGQESPGTRDQLSVQVKSDVPNKSKTPIGTVSGLVRDPNGVAVDGAEVTLAGASWLMTALTDDEGRYRFAGVPIGGFKASASNTSYRSAEAQFTVAEGENEGPELIIEPPRVELMVMGGIGFADYSHPLFRAVSDDDADLIKQFVGEGADVNVRDSNYGEITPLFLAVENGSAKAVELLLEYGAKANARDENGQTPMMRIDEDATPELIELLIKFGADPNLTDQNGNNALILGARYASAAVGEALARETKQLDARNSAGRTALMEAADADNFEVVEVLLLAGASALTRDDDGETAYDLTSQPSIRTLLERYGARRDGN